MKEAIEKVLDKLGLEANGRYDNHFYIIPIANSNEYAEMYSHLSEVAVNTEYPEFTSNTNSSTVKVVNYFEAEIDDKTYNIFLIANFDEDTYYIKIGER